MPTKPLTTAQAMAAMFDGKSVRRAGWHNGRHFIYLADHHGFTEGWMRQSGAGGTIDWPLVLARGDWNAKDWHIVDQSDFPNIFVNDTSEASVAGPPNPTMDPAQNEDQIPEAGHQLQAQHKDLDPS